MGLKAARMSMPTSKVGTSSNRSSEREGFTLIELILVVAVIGVVAAIVLPRLDPFLPERRLKSAVRLLSGTISLAYGEAIAKNKTYRLYFDSTKNMYWITEVTSVQKEEETEGSSAMRLGTQFELLQYEKSSEKVEEKAPTEPMFSPRTLPDGVHFSTVEINRGLEMAKSDLPYIEFSPLGTAVPATIVLINDEGDQFAIEYDGVTGIPALLPLNSSTG